MELFQDAEFWVGIAFLIFMGVMVWVKVPGMAVKALDARADKIRAELAEAERLRKEAEQLLASIRARREAAEKQAAELVANAEVEARQLEAEAHVRLEEQIRRRGRSTRPRSPRRRPRPWPRSRPPRPSWPSRPPRPC